LHFDAPEAESAPTRRSSRSSATPTSVTAGTAGASRAELRRRKTQVAAESPAPIWAASELPALELTEVEPTGAALAPISSPAADMPAAAGSRRSRRTQPAAERGTAGDDAAGVAPVREPVLTTESFELLEPVIEDAPELTFDDAPEPEPLIDAHTAATEAEIDAFEAAARLFSFTGETAIQRPAQGDEPAAATAAHVAPRRNRGASFKRVTATSFSVGVMGIVGLLTVGLTTPADAVAAPRSAEVGNVLAASAGGDVAPADGEIQAYVTPTEIQSAPIQRSENYSTLTMAQLAADSGISNFSNFFINDPNSPIQWPFAVGVPISYGFGMRDGTMHEGVDFTPGEGSPIQAIADGVVRESTDSGGAFGVHIVIDHIIDGQLVSSSYSHMLYGSRQVEVGDHVTVGQIGGHTGNTGRSFGAHTHFEILANGTTPIDPIPWLREHAGG
jgi:murein DD-endopeptidase MepM/ murein hydrolase activator NlpD